MGKTYKDSERRGYDKRSKEQKRQQDRYRKQMNINSGELWDGKNKFSKDDYNAESYQDLYSN